MLLTTTPSVEGKHITAYYGVVSGETIIGANFLRDFMASVRDFLGGRSKAYEEVLREAKQTALREMEMEAQRQGADDLVGIDIEYESLGQSGRMQHEACGGKANRLED